MHAQANAIEAQVKSRGGNGAAPTPAPAMMPGNYKKEKMSKVDFSLLLK